MELTARIHCEDGSYWADVVELPGCFASGETFDELVEALGEAIAFCLEDNDTPVTASDSPVTAGGAGIEVAEMKVAMPAAFSHA